jgi:hypothetical protein
MTTVCQLSSRSTLLLPGAIHRRVSAINQPLAICERCHRRAKSDGLPSHCEAMDGGKAGTGVAAPDDSAPAGRPALVVVEVAEGRAAELLGDSGQAVRVVACSSPA